jgi:hypothetical protein
MKTTEDKKKFLDLVKQLCAVFGQFPSEEIGIGWYKAMEGATIEEFEKAAVRLMRGNRYMPRPVDVWELVREDRRRAEQRMQDKEVKVVGEPCPQETAAQLRQTLGIDLSHVETMQ